jgi:pyruvate dehydrogenase E1 component alpha subunit
MRIRRFEERALPRLRAYQPRRSAASSTSTSARKPWPSAAARHGQTRPRHHRLPRPRPRARRRHGHQPMMAELYGKSPAAPRARAARCTTSTPRNFWGGHGIVGGQIPLGTGLAYALKYKGLKGAALAFMGDGAVNQGAVHESYNLAALMGLPVDLRHREQRLLDGHQPGTLLGRRASPSAPRATAWHGTSCERPRRLRGPRQDERALKRAREKSLPAVVEIDTYRYRGHPSPTPTRPTATSRRSRSTSATKDPINVFQLAPDRRGSSPKPASPKIDTEAARNEAEIAANFAEASPFPTVEDIQKDVYWEIDNPRRPHLEGPPLLQLSSPPPVPLATHFFTVPVITYREAIRTPSPRNSNATRTSS